MAKTAAPLGQLLFAPGTAQYDWLVNDLNAADNDPAIKWKIVYMHFPPYVLPGDSLVPEVQTILAPLIDAYDVDLVITGHRRVYERSVPVYSYQIAQPQNRLKPDCDATNEIVNKICK